MLPVPNVEKNFLWHACNDILPTRENLCQRKVIAKGTCPMCDHAVESAFHCLWQCPAAVDVWSMGSKNFQKSFFQGLDFLQVVEGLFIKCDQEELLKFAGLVRRIWLRRNDVLHGGKFSHPNTIWQQTLNSIQEFALAQKLEQANGPHMVIRWQAPTSNWCKGNWDAAVNTESDRMGLGAVLRDSQGNLGAAKCVSRPGRLAMAATEAMAVMLAIKLCREVGCSRVQFEGDAKGVIDAVNSSEVNNSWMGQAIEDI